MRRVGHHPLTPWPRPAPLLACQARSAWRTLREAS